MVAVLVTSLSAMRTSGNLQNPLVVLIAHTRADTCKGLEDWSGARAIVLLRYTETQQKTGNLACSATLAPPAACGQ